MNNVYLNRIIPSVIKKKKTLLRYNVYLNVMLRVGLRGKIYSI